jgi:carbonic anhydrase/acetyltransferase-like protein (isoleucine patch superfamily)
MSLNRLLPAQLQPEIASSATLLGSVHVGAGAGVKIIGDSHGPVRIGSRVQILENAVLHLCSPTTSWSSRTTSSSGPAP